MLNSLGEYRDDNTHVIFVTLDKSDPWPSAPNHPMRKHINQFELNSIMYVCSSTYDYYIYLSEGWFGITG